MGKGTFTEHSQSLHTLSGIAYVCKIEPCHGKGHDGSQALGLVLARVADKKQAEQQRKQKAERQAFQKARKAQKDIEAIKRKQERAKAKEQRLRAKGTIQRRAKSQKR